MYVQEGEEMIMVHREQFHVLLEVFKEIQAEDFASPCTFWNDPKRPKFLSESPIEYGFDQLWSEEPSFPKILFSLHAKYLNFGRELSVNADIEIRMKKENNAILNGDLLVACNLTNTFTKAENIMRNLVFNKDPLIMGFTSIKLEQKVLRGKVCACFIDIFVRGINCYVLYYNDSHRTRMTLESS